MRDSRPSLIVLLTAVLFLAPAVFADSVPSEAPERALAVEGPPTVEAPADASDVADPITEWFEAPSWTDPVPKGSFGAHCSGPPAPWACSYTDGGLGCPPGGVCTYSCQCDNCVMSDGRIETPMINCTLVDNGGCLACPTFL
ncbi:MAG: hypothetical protein AAGE94_11410 [Acidobacteriota bacterium]